MVGVLIARKFQFTQPKRAATVTLLDDAYTFAVSIHAAQAGCDNTTHYSLSCQAVSIHAAQAGCDVEDLLMPASVPFVSIHAAQAGCDSHAIAISNAKFVFQFTQPKRAATVAAKIQQKRDSLKG